MKNGAVESTVCIMRLENVILYLNLTVERLERALGEECMQKEIHYKCTNDRKTVKDVLKEMIEVVKDVQLEEECGIVVDLDTIPTKIDMGDFILKATEINIIENRISGISDNHGEQEYFDSNLKFWMSLAKTFNNRAK